MALEPKQTVCPLCGNVRLTEDTGIYDQTTNPGGYGGPNAAFGDTTPYTAAFTPPGGTTPIFTLDLYDNPPVPDADGFYIYNIPPSSLGGVDEIISGEWIIEITLGTTTTRKAMLATAEIERRIRTCVCCDSLKYLDLYYELMGAWRQHNCYKQEEAQAIITELYRRTAECCDCGC